MNLKTTLLVTSALVIGASAASAGGIDRTRLPVSVLFEDGRYIELGFSSVTPSVTGATAGNVSTGNMAEAYSSLSFAYKADINDQFSYGVFVNQPYGANANYAEGLWNGLQADWKSQQVAALLKYDLTERASVYGGLRVVQSSAEIAIPASVFNAALPVVPEYTASTSTDTQVGYVLGAAYQIPDIALRVGLTYESGITHEFDTKEAFAGTGPLPTLSAKGTTEIEMPQSVTLDFQTGIAKDTLLFGSVRWSEWSVWHVRPTLFETVTGDEVTGIKHDVMTYQLGLGRKINENLSVFARASYEPGHSGLASRLSPTNGMRSIGLGASWKQDHVKITGGLEYAELGDAKTAGGAKFKDNSAVGLGLTVAYTF